MSGIKYNMFVLTGLEEFDLGNAEKNFANRQDYFDKLTEVAKKANSYLLSYTPDVVVYSDEMAQEFSVELESVRQSLRLLGAKNYVEQLLDGMNDAIEKKNSGILSDLLTQFRAQMQLLVKTITKAQMPESKKSLPSAKIEQSSFDTKAKVKELFAAEKAKQADAAEKGKQSTAGAKVKQSPVDAKLKQLLDEAKGKQSFADVKIKKTSAALEDKNKLMVLAVDDNPEILTAINSVLKDKYRVVGMTDSNVALKALDIYSPALFLLDIEMPGLSGYELAKSIRAMTRFKKTPILFLTIKGSIETVITAKKCGANDYILKPVNKEVLLDKIKLHIGGAK